MSDVFTKCSKCGVGILAPSHFSGKVGKCPRCGADFVVGLVGVSNPDLSKQNDSEGEYVPVEPSIDISGLRFLSTGHKRFNSGVWNGSDDRGCLRGIEIVRNGNFDDSYLVTIHKLDGVHAVWGDNVQMAPKQMRVISSTLTGIVLRGYGHDEEGFPFADYGCGIHISAGKITYISMFMHDRDVRIDYLA